jgi:hypothetical protein
MRREQVYTALYVFKRLLRMANRGEDLTDKELNYKWAIASPTTKQNASQKANDLILRGPHLVDEVKIELLKTRGRIT